MQGTGHAPPRLAVAVLLAVLLGALAGPARADQTFTFAGHGYGHGVGMPQYGAEGYALAGGTYQQILGLYYPGTQLGPDTPNAQIRVLLQSGETSVEVASATGLVAHDETSGAAVAVPASAVVTQAAGSYTVTSSGAPLASGWVGPVLLSPAGASPVELVGTALYGGANRTYRGSIRVVLGASGLAAVNVLALEDYLRGVVPSEVPSSWRPAALEAQAVAARGYALATAAPVGSLFDVYADTRSQAYAGIPAETPQTDAAIAATGGQVLFSAGKLATTYFSSSSGGRTANVQEVFPGAQPTPYLVAVDDPYDGASPYHDWTVSFSGTRIASALGYAGTISSISLDAYPSGRVRTLLLDGSAGPKSVPAGTARTALGLRSTWFSSGTGSVVAAPVAKSVALTLAKPRVSNGHVLLHGTAPAGPVLLQGAAGASWRTLATVTPTATGRLQFTRKVGETPLYRLQQGVSATAAVRVSIASGLTVHRSATGFGGRLYPALAHRTVTLQRASTHGWVWMARAATSPRGLFALVKRGLPRGRYRVHFSGDSIYRPSSSPTKHVARALDRTLQWTPTDPSYGDQWNVRDVRAFDFWPQVPTFTGAPVTVAVVDGGIDDRSPDLVRPDGSSVVAQTIALAQGTASFVHGTAVAGIIAARANNGIGIAGIDQSVRLIDVRVVGADGTIDPRVEARGILKAVDAGARVINLSLGGKRAPGESDDEYSRAEQGAIDYAYSKGAVIVAAVGNSENPYPYASYPAALPHVIGVSAIGPDLRTPRFSNRDARFNDLAAPGVGILTTVPRDTTPSGLSQNAPAGDVVGPGGTVEGTSFAAPHVSAAAVLLMEQFPKLTNDQVMELLEHSAHDLVPHAGEGSPATTYGHDPLTGYGLVDIAAALTAASDPPAPDSAGEPNDKPYEETPLRGFEGSIQATVDHGDDPDDVYALRAHKGDHVRIEIQPYQSIFGSGLVDGVAWVPGTMNVSHLIPAKIAASTLGNGPVERLSFVASRSGTWPIEVIARKGWTSYRLAWSVGSSSSSGGTLLR